MADEPAIKLLSDSETALRLGVSEEAVRLTRESDVIDLHVDSFIPSRLWGYALDRPHGRLDRRRPFFGHLDLPRAQEGGLSGAMWSITTNPLRGGRGRWRTLMKNSRRLTKLMEDSRIPCAIVRNVREYREACAAGQHAVMLSIQGGNALSAAPDGFEPWLREVLIRVTLVHLSNSDLGATSAPGALTRRRAGLTARGAEMVQRLNDARIFVDLAHVSKAGFWDAVQVHDRTQPLLVTHTGVEGVTPHWRNLDDDQLRAVAETGGTIGIIFQVPFLRRPGGPADAGMVLEHMEHVIHVVGEDHVSIGSDFDGAIIPPRDLASAETYPRLTQRMLDAGWSIARIQKVLGGNALRTLEHLRPD